MNELKVLKTRYTLPSIEFPEYEGMMEQAGEIYDYLTTVKVTEETVKESKKLVANLNKKVRTLEDERIRIKKEILKPYSEFEGQIKEIVNLVKSADDLVRSQIRDIEERKREEKRQEIEEMFEKRSRPYDFVSHLGFEMFFNERFLNTTVSMKSIESEMVAWFEKTKREVDTLESMGPEYLAEYIKKQDVAEAIQAVNGRKEILRKIEEDRADNEDVTENNTKETVYVFKIIGERDGNLAELALEKYNIAFTKEVMKC